MNPQEIAERIVYGATGQPTMLPDAPYQKVLIENIVAALNQARDDSRHQVGRCLIGVADELLHDPKADAVDGHVSAVLRDLGTKLTEMTGDQLVQMGLEVLAEEIIAERARSHET